MHPTNDICIEGFLSIIPTVDSACFDACSHPVSGAVLRAGIVMLFERLVCAAAVNVIPPRVPLMLSASDQGWWIVSLLALLQFFICLHLIMYFVGTSEEMLPNYLIEGISNETNEHSLFQLQGYRSFLIHFYRSHLLTSLVKYFFVMFSRIYICYLDQHQGG